MNIVVVGPVPPPVDGRAQATGWLIDTLREAGHRVRVFDTQLGAVAKGMRCFRAAAVLACRRPPDRVIVVASGGPGLLAEAVPLFVTRVRRIPVSLSHHSARYIREDFTFLRVAFAAAGPRLRHVVLDSAMGAELTSRYGIEPTHVVVVDNSGLMPLPPAPDPLVRRRGVVHLSNLSEAKGLVPVLNVADRTNISVRLIGSITPATSAILDDFRRRGVPFEALGPRYGDAKQRALLDARCFLFLSSYRHEAQPLVLYEAVGAGCVPVVWRAGWVAEQLERLGLGQYVLPVGDVEGAARLVSEITSMDDDSFAEMSTRIRSAFESHHRSTVHQYQSAVK